MALEQRLQSNVTRAQAQSARSSLLIPSSVRDTVPAVVGVSVLGTGPDRMTPALSAMGWRHTSIISVGLARVGLEFSSCVSLHA